MAPGPFPGGYLTMRFGPPLTTVYSIPGAIEELGYDFTDPLAALGA